MLPDGPAENIVIDIATRNHDDDNLILDILYALQGRCHPDCPTGLGNHAKVLRENAHGRFDVRVADRPEAQALAEGYRQR